jgi:DNA polymerase-4
VRTCGDVLARPREHWERRIGKYGGALHDRANGIDPGGVTPTGEAKSCSAENTFAEDTTDRAVLTRWLLAQAERVGADLRAHGHKGRTVTLKVKYADFTQITRSRTLDGRTDATAVIFETARQLLDQLELPRAVRLIGVGVSGFEPRARQLSLLDDPAERMEATSGLDLAVDAVRRRFGTRAVTRVDLLDMKKKDTP